MAKQEWTDQQTQCLTAKGTVLVSAAAGSGKTTVLVERLIRLITDPVDPVDVDRLLVVTFTNAAAAEMKQRIGRALSGLLAADPGNRRLRAQLMKLPRASVSTVHGFCGDLIREYFHRLPDVSPGCRVGEVPQTAALLAAALDEVIGEAYEEEDPAFARLRGVLSGDGSDRGLSEQLEKLHGFVQAEPFPDRWLERAAAAYRRDLPPEQTPWGKEILQSLKREMEWCVCLCRQGIRMTDPDGALRPLAEALEKDVRQIRELQSRVDTDDWDQLYARLQALNQSGAFAVCGRIAESDCADPGLKKKVSGFRKSRIHDKLRKLWKQMLGTREQIRRDTAELAPCVELLCELTRRLSRRYGEKKSAAGIMDYNDMEHFALQLLAEEQEGELVPTPLAREVAQRFDWVMVDEYQDTNPTQETIFRAVSRGESNLFLVGDVKQSVYAFRNATPELFIARQNLYPPFDGVSYPSLIRLGHNFRSRRGVIDTVNFLCRLLMTEDTCGVDYSRGEELVYHTPDYSEKEEFAELILVDNKAADQEGDKDLPEAVAIVKRLREMKDTLTVYDKEAGGDRPLRWGDVCILLRSVKTHAFTFEDQLRRAGIPAVCESGSGFYSAPEVMLTASFLRFLDNPMEEVSLLAVLMSPLFAFTPDDMAFLRADKKRSRSLYALLRRCARGEEGPAAKCRAFLRVTDRLRTRAASLPADLLLGVLYEETGLIPVMAARSHGEQRVANLHKLWDTARSFEQTGYRGLSAFVRYLDRESERDQNDRPAPVAGGPDAVRILSIHKSKGLEFPVVFLAGLGRQFNDKSSEDVMLLHRELGIGVKYYDDGELIVDNTPQRAALAKRITREGRAEELRILYVALTRARERLCMVFTGSPADLLTKALLAGIGPALPAEAILSARSMGEWVAAALLRHPAAGLLREKAGAPDMAVLPCGSGLTVSFAAGEKAEEAETAPAQLPDPDPVYLETLQRRVEYEYPFRGLAAVPAKLAASHLADRQRGEAFVAAERPGFLSESGLTFAERGTAVHMFMQFADYAAGAADPEEEIRRLVRQGFLTAFQGKSLPRGELNAFFSSDLYRRIAASPRVLREYAFTVERPADCPPDMPGAEEERTVVQGIADCVFLEGDRYVIVDYKTDRAGSLRELADRYRPQLEAYRQALGEMLDAPVGECLLYSFCLRQTVRI